MMYTTLKANKENGVDFIDIAYDVEESWTVVADLFDNSEKYHDEQEETDFDKLYADYTERQVASACIKYMKKLAKDKEEPVMIYGKIFIDLDCDGAIAYDQVKQLVKDGVITGSNQLKEIDKKAKKNGVTIRKDICYDMENHYWRFYYISDIIEEYFPCYSDTHDGYCNNCGNCW